MVETAIGCIVWGVIRSVKLITVQLRNGHPILISLMLIGCDFISSTPVISVDKH